MKCPTCGQSMPETELARVLLSGGKTYRQVAKEAGVAPSTVWRWAAGKDINLSHAQAIAKALGAPLESLLEPLEESGP